MCDWAPHYHQIKYSQNLFIDAWDLRQTLQLITFGSPLLCPLLNMIHQDGIFTYKARKIVIDSFFRQPSPQLPFLLQHPMCHLYVLFGTSCSIIALHCWVWWLFEFSLAAFEEVFMHFFRWHKLACITTRISQQKLNLRKADRMHENMRFC